MHLRTFHFNYDITAYADDDTKTYALKLYNTHVSKEKCTHSQ